MSKANVAILGLGIMGSGMAHRLLSANFPLAVYNRNRAKCIPFAGAGAFIAASTREAASRSDIILSMVADDAASRDVWLGEDGALIGASPSSLLIESSTLSGGWIHELATKTLRQILPWGGWQRTWRMRSMTLRRTGSPSKPRAQHCPCSSDCAGPWRRRLFSHYQIAGKTTEFMIRVKQ